jgi:hypothetical protein
MELFSVAVVGRKQKQFSRKRRMVTVCSGLVSRKQMKLGLILCVESASKPEINSIR